MVPGPSRAAVLLALSNQLSPDGRKNTLIASPPDALLLGPHDRFKLELIEQALGWLGWLGKANRHPQRNSFPSRPCHSVPLTLKSPLRRRDTLWGAFPSETSVLAVYVRSENAHRCLHPHLFTPSASHLPILLFPNL